MKFIWAIVAILAILITFAIVAANSSGEPLEVIPGQIQSCTQLGSDNTESIVHATIKTESNQYLVAAFVNCSAGTRVKVIKRRGILYFNTVYDAEKT